MTISAIVRAYNEAATVPACLYSLRAQTRPPDEILLVNNASTDDTHAVGSTIPGVRVLDEPAKGLVRARETGRLAARGTHLAFIDADCRAPLRWVERVARLSTSSRETLAVDRAGAPRERGRRAHALPQRHMGGLKADDYRGSGLGLRFVFVGSRQSSAAALRQVTGSMAGTRASSDG